VMHGALRGPVFYGTDQLRPFVLRGAHGLRHGAIDEAGFRSPRQRCAGILGQAVHPYLPQAGRENDGLTIVDVTENLLGSPVMMVKVCIHSSSCGGRQPSHRPANISRSPAGSWMKYGCLFGDTPFHSKYPLAGTRDRRFLNAFRNDGFVTTVSARALIVFTPSFRSFAHDGTRPKGTPSPCSHPPQARPLVPSASARY